MGIKQNTQTGLWEVYYSKRHPITGMPVTLRRKNIRSKALALKIEKELVVLVSDKLRLKSAPTWRQAVENFCIHANSEGFNLKTVDNYFICLKAHTFNFWGERNVDTITTDEIRQLISQSGTSESTKKNILKMIRGVFKFIVEKGYVDRNPVPHMKFKKVCKIRGSLNLAQATKLLNTARELNHEWYPIWAMALYTGMRNGELYALTWDNVDFESKKILVNCSWNNKDGFKSTKSGDDRLIDISPSLMPLLRDLKIQSSDRVFVLPRLPKWDAGYQAEELRRFLIGIGIESVRFHDLRASWATMLLNKGLAPVKVMAMGGWKDIKTMMIYMRKAGVDIDGSMQILDLGISDSIEPKVLSFPSTTK